MFAVIKTGGKQYKVSPSDVIAVEKLARDPGAAFAIDEVLMVGEGSEVEVGAPFVDGAKVSAELVEHTRGDKVIIFKKRRRQNSRRKNGHRQDLSLIRITEIAGLGRVAKAEGAEAAPKAKRTRKTKAKAEGEAQGSPETAEAETTE
jgi:large subunit ribosomal protein L21